MPGAMFGFIRSISFTVQIMVPVVGLILFGVAWLLPGNLQPGDTYGNGFFYLPSEGWLYTLWQGMARMPLWSQMAVSCLTAIHTAGMLVTIRCPVPLAARGWRRASARAQRRRAAGWLRRKG